MAEEKQGSENSNRAFLARMSHEIRTPMNGIIGTASLLEGTELNETQKNYLQTIKNSGQALLVILNEILDFSQLEAGELKIAPEPFDIYHCIDDIYHLFQAPINDKNLVFELIYDDLPEYIIADQGRVRQVTINLINNAIKFTDKGAVKLEIAVAGEYIKFSIHDSGCGIAQHKQKKLFQAFSQVDDSSARKASGTGLGLSICKSLVEMMGGKIGVTSEDNKGSCFWFSVPLIIPSEEELSEFFDNIPKIEGKNAVEFKYNAKALVADDVEVNRFIAANLLKEFGCTVDIAENGREAVDMSNSAEYDIIFTDFQMPIMNGIEATTAIRKTRDKTPIIGYTANYLTEEKNKAMSAGMNDFIYKPATKESFAAILNKHISHLLLDNITTTPPINAEFLEQFGSHKNKIIELSIQDADKFIASISSAIELKDCEEAGLGAHALKSILSQIGAIKASEIAGEIELKASANEIDIISTLFKNLTREHTILLRYLKDKY